MVHNLNELLENASDPDAGALGAITSDPQTATDLKATLANLRHVSEQLADEIGAPLLGRVPIEATVSGGGDSGEPAALGSGPAATELRAIAAAIAEEHVPPVEMAGCSARMLDAAMAALDALDENESSTEPAGDAATESASATAAVQRSSSGGSSGRS